MNSQAIALLPSEIEVHALAVIVNCKDTRKMTFWVRIQRRYKVYVLFSFQKQLLKIIVIKFTHLRNAHMILIQRNFFFHKIKYANDYKIF